MKIRAYAAADATALANLFRRSIEEIGSRDYAAPQVAAWAARVPTAERLHALAADGRTRLVAVDEADRPLAFVDLEPDGHIDFLYAAPEAAGTGVVAALYGALERGACDRKIARLYAEASEAARRFFLKQGFVVTARREFEIAGVPIHNYAVEKILVDVPLPSAAQRVAEVLAAEGHPGRVRIMPASTRTAVDAAMALGCDVAQIAKSIVFRAKNSGRAILVVASGANRIDEKKVGRLVGEKLGRADADFVREATGFAIGGIPPVAHTIQPVIVIDEDLIGLGDIWAAAGTPHAVFPLRADDLVRLTAGVVADVKRDGA